MGELESSRRSLLMAAPLLLAALAAGDKPGNIGDITLSPAPKTGPDPDETFTLPYGNMNFEQWGSLPPHSGEMARLYGDFDEPGPYLVMMKWNPGWFSAPHTYATDRIQVVVFGTWFVNSGNDFQPQDAVPVGPGGYLNPPDPEGSGFLAQAACSLGERSGLMPSAPAGLKPARLSMTCAEFLSRGATCPQWSHR
jgi:hypothetical protein